MVKRKVKSRPPRLFQDSKGRIYVIIGKKKIQIKTNSLSDDYSKRELLDIILKQKRVRKRRKRKTKDKPTQGSFSELEKINRNQNTKLRDSVLQAKIISQALTPFKDVNIENRQPKKQLLIKDDVEIRKPKKILPPKTIELLTDTSSDVKTKTKNNKRVLNGKTLWFDDIGVKIFDSGMAQLEQAKSTIEKKQNVINKGRKREEETLLKSAELIKIRDDKKAIRQEVKRLGLSLGRSEGRGGAPTKELLDKVKNYYMQNGMIEAYNQWLLDGGVLQTVNKELGVQETFDDDNVDKMLKEFTEDDIDELSNILSEEKKQRLPPETLEGIPDDEEQEAAGTGNGLLTSQINEIMESYIRKGFLGTFPIDKIGAIDTKKKRFGFVINLDSSDKPGSHWVACYIDTNKDMSAEYYDSFGDNPPKEFMKNIKKLIDKLNVNVYLRFKVSKIIQQDNDSNNCGYFAVRFLMERLDGIPWTFCSGWDDSIKSERDIKKFKKRFPKFGYI